MTELRHYTSFEDLKNSPLSAEQPVTPMTVAEREKQWIEFINLVRSSMEPSKPNKKSNGK
jgi:hypothetical protein